MEVDDEPIELHQFGGSMLEKHVEDLEVHAAVRTALQMGTISFDAVKHLVLCRIERRPPRLDLDVYPYLPRATVGTTGTPSSLDSCSTSIPTP